VQPTEYPLDFEVSSLPAVCYPPDVVEPFLRVTGRAPNGYPLEVSWEVAATGGAVRRRPRPRGRSGRVTTSDGRCAEPASARRTPAANSEVPR